MAWSWSHSQEAYDNAYQNVQNKDREWLETVFAEWHACKDPIADCESFNERKYNAALKKAKKLPPDILADYIWDRMSEYAVCTNGGHEAYACPSGCGPHLVSFEHEETDEERKDREKDEAAEAEMEAAFMSDDD